MAAAGVPPPGGDATARTADAPMPAFPRATPAEQGIDPASLAELSGRFETGDLGVDSLMVLSRGAVVHERWWRGWSPDRARTRCTR